MNLYEAISAAALLAVAGAGHCLGMCGGISLGLSMAVQEDRRIEQIGPIAAGADGVDSGVFHEQQGFRFAPGGNPGNEPLLKEE